MAVETGEQTAGGRFSFLVSQHWNYWAQRQTGTGHKAASSSSASESTRGSDTGPKAGTNEFRVIRSQLEK